MARTIFDKVIYDAPGLKNDFKRPVLVIEIGEDGDLIEHYAFDAGAEDALATITEHMPEALIASLQEDKDDV